MPKNYFKITHLLNDMGFYISLFVLKNVNLTLKDPRHSTYYYSFIEEIISSKTI